MKQLSEPGMQAGRLKVVSGCRALQVALDGTPLKATGVIGRSASAAAAPGRVGGFDVDRRFSSSCIAHLCQPTTPIISPAPQVRRWQPSFVCSPSTPAVAAWQPAGLAWSGLERLVDQPRMFTAAIPLNPSR